MVFFTTPGLIRMKPLRSVRGLCGYLQMRKKTHFCGYAVYILPKKFKLRCEGKHRDESQVPGLVNPSMLKDGKDGTQRLNGTMRKKMGESIYHQLGSWQKKRGLIWC